MTDGIERVAVWLSAVVAGLVALVLTLRGFGHVLSRVQHFLDDWFGEEGRHGTDRRPGVMERIEAIEDRLYSIEVKQDLAQEQADVHDAQ